MADPLQLIHELQTYQIELELQNEALRISQQELMKSQMKYTELYDFSPVGYMALSLKGLVLNANLTLAHMLATERSFLIHQPLSAYIVFEDQDIYYRHLQTLSELKTRQMCELRMKKKSGEILHVHLESTLIPEEHGEPGQYRTVVMDICQRKEAEEVLRQFQSIVSSSFDMIALIDDGFIYLATNHAYLKAFGKTREEIIGHSVPEIFGQEFFKKIIKPNAEKCLAGQDVRFSDWFEFPVLGRRYLDIQYSPYTSHDKKIKGFVVNARDITPLKQSELLLEYSKRQLETVLNNLEEKVKERTAELEDMNAALTVLLKKREEDRDEIEEKIFSNHKRVLSPLIQNLKKGISQKSQQDLINILESELKNIISPFSKKLSDKMINLTPTEIHIADLVKFGKSNKEISKMLNISIHTVSRHRENIRKKTGLKNQKINLRSFLLTLE